MINRLLVTVVIVYLVYFLGIVAVAIGIWLAVKPKGDTDEEKNKRKTETSNWSTALWVILAFIAFLVLLALALISIRNKPAVGNVISSYDSEYKLNKLAARSPGYMDNLKRVRFLQDSEADNKWDYVKVINIYAGDCCYRLLNRFLSGEDLDEEEIHDLADYVKEAAKEDYLKKRLQKYSAEKVVTLFVIELNRLIWAYGFTSKKTEIVYRGMWIDKGDVPENGKSFDIVHSFVSTSTSKDTAESFSGHDCCLFTIQLPKEKVKMFPLYLFTNSERNLDEAEVLLPSGTDFVVKNRNKNILVAHQGKKNTFNTLHQVRFARRWSREANKKYLKVSSGS